MPGNEEENKNSDNVVNDCKYSHFIYLLQRKSNEVVGKDVSLKSLDLEWPVRQIVNNSC